MTTVLITGAGGFIGSHLVESSVKNNYRVKAFLHYNSQNSWGWLDTSKYKDKIEVICGDIRDYDSVDNALEGCDIVFHLAALIGIPYSYISPLAYIKTNIEGTYNILQASKKHKLKKVIITSTSETYGTAQYVPIDEVHPVIGQSPYSASKISADQLAVSYHRSFNVPVSIIRPFNTYGPRQSARAIIPTVISQILSGQKKIKLGSTYPTRDLTYVKDTVKGFIKTAESSNSIGEIINIASNFEISIKDLAKKIATIMDVDIKIVSEPKRKRPLKSEVERLWADNKKAKDLLGWHPEYSLEKGLQATIKWLKDNIHLYKADIYNV